MHSFHRQNLSTAQNYPCENIVQWDGDGGGKRMLNSWNAIATQYLLGFHSKKSYEAFGELAREQFQLWWFVIQQIRRH